MAVGHESLQTAFKDLGLGVERNGEQYVYVAKGKFASVLKSIVTPDEDGSGVTVVTALDHAIARDRRTTVCELLNLVHGQGLWNVRFHLDEDGRVFSIGKCLLWGRPFNPLQFGDIFFSLLVSTDRLSPCLSAITDKDKTAEQAFTSFFAKDS